MGDFGIQEGIMLAGAIKDIDKMQKTNAFEAQVKTHLAGFQSNPEYKADMTTPDYDPKAFAAATHENFINKMQDKKFQQAVFQERADSMKDQYGKTTAFIKQMNIQKAANNRSGYRKAAEAAYDQSFTGDDLSFGKDGKTIIITDKLSGKQDIQKFATEEELDNHLEIMANQIAQPDEYQKMLAAARDEKTQMNLNQQWTPVEGAKGEAGYVSEWYNKKDDKVEKVYQFNGQLLTQQQAMQMGFVSLPAAKMKAEIDYKKEATKQLGIAGSLAHKKTKTEKARVKGTQEKQAEGYMVAYGITKEEAMDMIRSDQAKGNIADQVSKYIVDNMLEMDDEEDKEAVRTYRDSLIREYAPTVPSTRKATGLPTPKEKEKVPVSRLPSTKGLKEGQTAGKGKYVIKDGQWTIAK